MIYAINAVAIGFIAAIWSKKGGLNIVLAFTFTVLALFNAALAAPLVYRLVG
jgi:hypothetical protein